MCVGNSGALEEEYISKWLEQGSPLRASAPDTYTSPLLASLSPKQKKERTKTQTERRSGGVPSKLKKPVKKALFQSNVLVPGPSRDVAEEVVVRPRAQ